jgi:hypothetical protein
VVGGVDGIRQQAPTAPRLVLAGYAVVFGWLAIWYLGWE